MRDRSRFFTLMAMESTRLGALFGMRAANVIGILIAVGYGVVLIAAPGGSELAAGVVARALFWLSWLVAGIAALSLARDLGALSPDDGFAVLAAQRGFPPSALAPARLAAGTVRIARSTALPGLALAVLAGALASSPAAFLSALVLAAQVLGYCILLGATLALLARWAALLQPDRAGLLLSALVLLPELVRDTWSGVPSVPAFFGALLDQLPARGVSP